MLCFSGCAFTDFNTQNLMSPPKANADQQSIHALLQGNAPDITFIYPKSGEYRSAVIMQDFTGDGAEDAVGFHALEEGGVEVQFLTKIDGEWTAAAAFQNTATQVDRVCFGEINGDGVPDVLIGWGSTAGATGRTAAASVYIYSGGNISEHILTTYGELSLTDFDGNEVNEIFIIDKYLPAEEEEGAEPIPAQAKLFIYKDGGVSLMTSTNADNSIVTYSSVMFAPLNSSMSGVTVDGAKADGSLTTQIFTLFEGRLRNSPKNVNEESYVNAFSRPSTATFYCRDINEDGCIELPVASLLPGFPSDVTPDSTSYLVQWSTFENLGGHHATTYTLMNIKENYYFRLPYALRGNICATNDAELRTVTYTEVLETEEGEKLLGSPLFSIRVFTKSAWESRGELSGYELLTSQSDSVYGVQIFTENEEYLKYINMAMGNFRLLSA